MTPDPRAAALVEIVEMEGDRAFAREYFERGGHSWHFSGIPEKQAELRRELPLKFVVIQQMEHKGEQA